jgi:hypothetical protein
MVAPFEMRCAEAKFSPIRKTTPGRLRDRCRCVTAIAPPRPPFSKGECLTTVGTAGLEPTTAALSKFHGPNKLRTSNKSPEPFGLSPEQRQT